MARQPNETVDLRLRLPEALRAQLAAEAEKADRSLNSEILWRLGHSLGEGWQEFVAEAEERERVREAAIKRLHESPWFQEELAKLLAKQPELKKRKGKGDAS